MAPRWQRTFEAKGSSKEQTELEKKYKTDNDGGFALKVSEMKRDVIKLNNLKGLTALPEKGQEFLIISNSYINAFTFFHYITEKYIEDIPQLDLTRKNMEKKLEPISCDKSKKNILDYAMFVSYSFNESAVYYLQEMLDNRYLKNCDVIMTDTLLNRYTRAYIRLELMSKEHKGLRTIYTNNHAKILLCQVGDDYYVMHGSGNFAKNNRIEQYSFSNNKQSFMFFKERMLWLTTAKVGEIQE